MFSHMEMQFFTNIWFQIFFWFIKFRASSAIRYSIVVVSIVWNIPQKHHTIPAEVLPNDSEALFIAILWINTVYYSKNVKLLNFVKIMTFCKILPPNLERQKQVDFSKESDFCILYLKRKNQ